MTVKKVNPGDTQISAASWNEMRDFVNNYAIPQNTYKNGGKNPFLISVKNNSGGNLDALSVVKISSATYGSRTETVFRDKATEFGTELNCTKPDSEEDDIAILQEAIKQGCIGKAIADGCTAAFIYKEQSEHTYKYAKPINDQTSYLKGCDEPTKVRVLWHATGSGKVNAYICLDAAGAGDPLKVASKMVNTDSRPEGAFLLETTGTWLYADAIDSFAKENDNDPPAVANPCGYPEDRPVIIGKCVGFQGIDDNDSSENTPDESESGSGSGSESPEVEAVAIACDTREFFMINNNASSSSSGSTDSNNNTTEDYSKGSLVYIKYHNGRWIPDNSNYTNRLAVCQRDMPSDWSKEFRMPYYTPEQNYGAEPKRSTGESTGSGSSSSQSSTEFTERCGVKPGEHEFSNQRLDYHYANGRYSYEPRFIFIGEAKAGSNSYGVAVEIEGNDYDVTFPTPRSATSHPDIYEGDTITVEVDARGAEPVLTAIDYPMDFAEDTVILTHNGKPGRGWEDVTYTKNNGDLTAGNGDILVWDKANDKIIAEWTVHQCTCSGGAPSSDSGSSGGGGHTCSHGKITPIKTQAKWWKKVKTDEQNSALL